MFLFTLPGSHYFITSVRLNFFFFFGAGVNDFRVFAPASRGELPGEGALPSMSAFGDRLPGLARAF